MENLVMKSKYSTIQIYSEIDDIRDKIQSYMYSYSILTYGDRNDSIDATVYIFKSKYNNRDIKINTDKHEVGVILSDFDRPNQLYLKRLLINLNNRIMESKRVVFIHASSISYNDNGIMFVGEKGNGKTTSMLYMLNNRNVNYVANERTGIKLNKENNEIDMLGIPSNINVRPGTFENNRELKNKFMPILGEKGYYSIVKDTDEKSMKNRICITIQELKDYLGIIEKPISNLKRNNFFKI